jgi:hypothetical protein
MASCFAQRQLSFYIHEVRFAATADLVYVLMYSLLLLFNNNNNNIHSLFFDCPYTSNKTDRPDARLRHAHLYFRALRQNCVCVRACVPIAAAQTAAHCRIAPEQLQRRVLSAVGPTSETDCLSCRVQWRTERTFVTDSAEQNACRQPQVRATDIWRVHVTGLVIL